MSLLRMIVSALIMYLPVEWFYHQFIIISSTTVQDTINENVNKDTELNGNDKARPNSTYSHPNFILYYI